jgi:two-component system response regulator AtoC
MIKTRLLVVDDELFVRELLEEYFSKLDYLVDTADCAEHALELLEEREYHAALIDLKLPEMNGIELLQQLRAQGSSLPVVLMTGYPTVDSAVGALRGQAADYVLKPFRLQELAGTVAAAAAREGVSGVGLPEFLQQQAKPAWKSAGMEVTDSGNSTRVPQVSGRARGESARRLRLTRRQPQSSRS